MIKGRAKKDIKTKNLVNRLKPGDIAVIKHEDIDEVAAVNLAEKRVKAIVNACLSISGKYPNQGPKILSQNNIPIIDNIGNELFDFIQEDDILQWDGNKLYINNEIVGQAFILTEKEILKKMEDAADNIDIALNKFINNTLQYAHKEKDVVLTPLKLPRPKQKIQGKHVLVVIRGRNYKEDLKAIRSYIEEVKPIMIGVDGGGDALLDYGFKPDILIGDMDSVSDKCIRNCKQIIVHAYPDGRCPGMDRICKLGLTADILSYPGTSEDIALIFAYENKAELIVTVGSHTNMIDFLEKGRPGMASTILVRMKVGYKIVDAKGVNELYKNQIKPRYVAAIFAAALFPIVLISRLSPQIREIYRLLALKIRLFLGC